MFEGGNIIIINCNESDLDDIFKYIGDDYGKCLYIYIDLKKYGLNDDNFNVWIQYNNQNEICAIISEYYKGFQIYSKQYDLIASEIADFLKELNPNVIFGMKKTIDQIKGFLPDYLEEVGFVGKLGEINFPINDEVYSASLSEIGEIVELVVLDENMGKPYGYDILYNQYYSRKVDNFGRNFILRDKTTNELVSHAGTNAEISELAVLGGVITAVSHRGKGFSKSTLSTLCNVLKSENKEVFSFYYVPIAKKMHNSLGFKEIGEWAKLKK